MASHESVQDSLGISSHFATFSTNQSGATVLRIAASWTIENIPLIEQALQSKKIPSGQPLIVNGENLEALDTSGAWVLIAFIRSLKKKVAETPLEGFHENYKKIIEIVSHIEHPASIPLQKYGVVENFFQHIGKGTVSLRKDSFAFVAFFGQLCIIFFRTLLRPRRLRFRSVVYHVNEVGIKAVPIIALMAFLLSIVTGYQGAHQLEKFGATIFTVDLIAISLLREMGVVVTSIMVAGRSSSAFAAQIGVMQVNEEVDAMRTIGLDPFELLVLPRIVGILIALPILTFIADIFGLIGGLVISSLLLDMSNLQFLERLRDAVGIDTFWIGLVKTPVFSILIGMVGCMQGLLVRNSAAEVGMRTTTAVVQAIFLVMAADALFSVLFTLMGI